MINCKKCGTDNQDGSKFCINCGEKLIVATGQRGPSRSRQPVAPSRRRSREVGYATGKSPGVACVMSLLIVGLGQFYNGDTKKGGILLGAGFVLGILSAGLVWFGLAVYSAYDAYQVANGQKQLEQW